jgi:hypothetical protein
MGNGRSGDEFSGMSEEGQEQVEGVSALLSRVDNIHAD